MYQTSNVMEVDINGDCILIQIDRVNPMHFRWQSTQIREVIFENVCPRLNSIKFVTTQDIISIFLVYPSRAHDFTSAFHRGSWCSVVCVSLFHVIVLSFW